MDANKAIAKEGWKWRCQKHPNNPSDIICLDGDSKDRVMCFRCYQVNPVQLSNLISMGCVLGSKEHDILETYPPLKDQEISDRLKQIGFQQYIDEIDLYFKKLREDFEREIKAAQQRAKEILIKQEQARQKVLEEYFKIAEIQTLKQLIVSDKEGAEKDLDEFIKDKWKKAEENRSILQDLIKQYDTRWDFSIVEPNRIIQTITDCLKSINFFEQSLKQEVNLIKSTYGVSQQLAITKINNSIYQIKQEASSGWGQVFLDPILNSFYKYVLQIELELQPGNSDFYFFTGIVNDEVKDINNGYNQKMSYSNYSNNYGVTKYIKGNPIKAGTKLSGKHCFEVRIHLNQKLLRVASLPDYSSITELDDPNKIDPKIKYRFFLAVYYNGDMIRINTVNIVDKFDDKM